MQNSQKDVYLRAYLAMVIILPKDNVVIWFSCIIGPTTTWKELLAGQLYFVIHLLYDYNLTSIFLLYNTHACFSYSVLWRDSMIVKEVNSRLLLIGSQLK